MDSALWRVITSELATFIGSSYWDNFSLVKPDTLDRLDFGSASGVGRFRCHHGFDYFWYILPRYCVSTVSRYFFSQSKDNNSKEYRVDLRRSSSDNLYHLPLFSFSLRESESDLGHNVGIGGLRIWRVRKKKDSLWSSESILCVEVCTVICIVHFLLFFIFSWPCRDPNILMSIEGTSSWSILS